MLNKPGRVCPVERSGALDSRIRRWFQNPRKILAPYVTPGMTVMDFGCGPGFFTLDMARLVGDAGSVIATDLQSGMLEKLGKKFRGTGLENRVTLHQCETGSINFAQPIDLFFSFYVLHEVPDQNAIFQEISKMLNPGGFVFLAEPPVHVSQKRFAATVAAAERNGLRLREKPRVFFSKTALLIKDA